MDLAFQNYLVACVFCAGIFAARPLVNLNILVYRKIHLDGLARFWQRQLAWWIPTVRIICAIGAVVFILSGLGMIKAL